MEANDGAEMVGFAQSYEKTAECVEERLREPL